MKLLLILLFPLLSFSDGIPSWWNLPDRGKTCFITGIYQTEDTTCGVKRTESWTCAITDSIGSPAIKQEYLLEGVYNSDVRSSCSPVFSVEKVIKKK